MSEVVKESKIVEMVKIPNEILPFIKDLTGKKSDQDAIETFVAMSIINFVKPQAVIDAIAAVFKNTPRPFDLDGRDK